MRSLPDDQMIQPTGGDALAPPGEFHVVTARDRVEIEADPATSVALPGSGSRWTAGPTSTVLDHGPVEGEARS